MAAHKRFQSTLPARGATGQAAAYFRDDRISIHAPRTGSDEKCLRTGTTTLLFQSTLPARGATRESPCRASIQAYFNPRSPHGERHNGGWRGVPRLGISIRAPRTGSDPVATLKRGDQGEFQSTLPARGATSTAVRCLHICGFQSTLPARGATYAVLSLL